MLQIVKGGFKLNGQFTSKLVGRSAFKLPNIVGYHYSGDGGGDKGWNSLFYALNWVENQQRIFGEHCVLRVLHENAGWDPQSDSMFGRAPRDLGAWNRQALRDGKRETTMHPLGAKTLEWLYATSQSTGVVFEVVIDSTLKHDSIPAGEIDHVIRVVGERMGGLNEQYPDALIIPNVRNEWNAHNESGHSLADVNMWAFRWDRDDYTSNYMRPVVCPGGGNTFTYDVGPEPGKFAMGLIHPDRGDDWWNAPNMATLRRDARGMPVGFNESMYWVEPRNADRAMGWYRNREGWTHNAARMEEWIANAVDACDYFILHDEDGVSCNVDSTPGPTLADRVFGSGGGSNPPIPPPPEPPTPPTPPTLPPPPDPPIPAWSQLDRIEWKINQVMKEVKKLG